MNDVTAESYYNEYYGTYKFNEITYKILLKNEKKVSMIKEESETEKQKNEWLKDK